MSHIAYGDAWRVNIPNAWDSGINPYIASATATAMSRTLFDAFQNNKEKDHNKKLLLLEEI